MKSFDRRRPIQGGDEDATRRWKRFDDSLIYAAIPGAGGAVGMVGMRVSMGEWRGGVAVVGVMVGMFLGHYIRTGRETRP